MSMPLAHRSLACLVLGLGVLAVLCAGAAGATTVEKRTAASTDDAEESTSNGVTRTSGNDLELIHDSSDQVVGIRWTGLAIPSGATITAAYIQFAAKESQSEVTNLTLRAQAADNAGAFSSAKLNVSSRPRTTAAASWTPVAWSAGQAGAGQRTSDLSAVLQQVVSRQGWTSGNALVVIVTGSGHRTAWSYDGGASQAPLLHVEFSSAPPPDNPPVAALLVTQLASPALTVRADGSASTDTDVTPIASYRFDFGDSTGVTTTAPTATAQHTYAAAGTYTVRLTATDTGGQASAPAITSITVNPAPPPDNPPVAALSVTQLASPALTVRADGSASTDTDLTPIASYRFDFGDSTGVTTTAPTAIAQHTYAAAGTYTVRLTATDTGGQASAPAISSVTVNPAPPPDNPPVAALSVTQIASPALTVRADGSASTDTDLTPIASYRFDFGDSTVVTTTAPTAIAQHTYAAAGTYTVRLTATDTGGQASAPTTAGITVNPPATGGTTLERRVAASSDDAEERATGSMYTTSSDLELIHDASDQTVGMRWTGLAIPAGATITAAYVQFAANESQSEATNLTIRGQAADNAATFGSGTGDISTRPRTAAAASWAPVPWTSGEVGANQRTPDLSAVIRDVVSRPGWASGNALVLIVTGTGHRTAWAYDGRAASAPLLHVEFGGGSGPPGNQAPNGTIDSPVSSLAITAGQSVNFQGTGFDPDGNLPLAYSWDFGGGAANQAVEDPGAVTFGTPGTYTVRFAITDALGLADPTPDTRVITVGAPSASAADEIHWTFLDRTAVTFDWRGGSDSLNYGATAAYGRIAIAAVPDPLPWSSAGPFREARITGLTENTLYHYAIGGGPDRTFRTPPARGGSGFMVIPEGDIGSSTTMVTVQSEVAAQGPDFVLALGDLTYANNSGQAAVDAHFNAVRVWSERAAYMPVWGNHDWDPGDDLRNYKGRFDLPNPQASPGAPLEGCCGEDWSWFDYGNTRFISYPEPYTSAVRTDWQTRAAPIMDQAQADTSIRFIVTFGHRPPYSSGNHNSDTQWQTIMASLATSHSKYVLNLSGHSHDYERSYPQSGVVHITAGTGGQNLEATSDSCRWAQGCPPPAWSAFRAMHHVVLTLRFTSSTIEGVTYCGPADPTRNDIACTVGTVVDAFTIQAPALVAQGRPVKPLSPAPPEAFSLGPNHPNPFGAATDFQYALPVPARVEMSLYSVLGKQVRVLVDGVQAAGVHTVRVDGRALEPAVYFLRLRATGTGDPARRFTETRKILVIR